MGVCYFRVEVTYPFLYQNVTGGNLTFIDGRQNSEEKIKIEPMSINQGLHPSIFDMVLVMNDKARKRISARKSDCNGIYVSVDKITQKMPFIYLRINQRL